MPDMAIPKGLTEFDVDSVNNIRGLRGISECRWSSFLGTDFCWRMSCLLGFYSDNPPFSPACPQMVNEGLLARSSQC